MCKTILQCDFYPLVEKVILHLSKVSVSSNKKESENRKLLSIWTLRATGVVPIVFHFYLPCLWKQPSLNS